ncbi:MAG: chemotaxis response regulator protein-glutamate methylesterase, partial [Deltaproteobacteria bacterium]|nr:chemotaxis response regulator protein-glutamate methylesterase [Deltaproteobacteria bacterium]
MFTALAEKRVIRVMVVDDSSFMRKAIKGMLDDDPLIEVVAVARDGREAVEKVEVVKPDVITLDIEMPRMNGLEALKIIMEKHPLPVLMLSSLTDEGAQATFDALDLGALDYLPKQLDDLSCNIVRIQEELTAKVRSIARRSVKRRVASAPEKRQGGIECKNRGEERVKISRYRGERIAFIAIGASTGGPNAVQMVLAGMPGDCPVGLLVAQHMPKNFTAHYAERLNRLCKVEVREAKNGDAITPGTVLIAPGGHQTRLRRRGALNVSLRIDDNPPDAQYKPSVDITLSSAAECYPGRTLGVILTGMGSDGREGVKAIKEGGGKVIAQDEASCVV